MFKGIPLIQKTMLKPINEISKKDILKYHLGIGLYKFCEELFAPNEHIGTMCFPTVAKDNVGRRSQKMNYDCFISTMAELIKKYSDI